MIVFSILVIYFENGIRDYIHSSSIPCIAKCHLAYKQGVCMQVYVVWREGRVVLFFLIQATDKIPLRKIFSVFN